MITLWNTHLAALGREAKAQAADGAISVRRRVCGQHRQILPPTPQQAVLPAAAAAAARRKLERLPAVACTVPDAGSVVCQYVSREPPPPPVTKVS